MARIVIAVRVLGPIYKYVSGYARLVQGGNQFS